ncbi:MAG: HupE/UreJ family protein, partial [Acetobacteraceae bacterium]|nr:HupE/UreJ family protein [Acetobacteraceae bacterium]
SALQEFGLPKGALVPALASFNVGVEIGQIGIVAIVLPVLLALDHLFSLRRPVPQLAAAEVVYAGSARPVQVVYPSSAVIALFGTYWFLARTVLEGVIPNF